MEQTALNLLAIGVFALTLSSLLGPVLHISPIIPAVTTLGVMGLATLDTLSWENKGSTLLLDFLAPRHQRQRVLHHEAGHFLAASLLGIPITGYTLTAWEAFQQKQPGLGGVVVDTSTLIEKTLSPRELQLTLDRFCTVWMAGIAAEMLIYGKAEGGANDRQQLQEALMIMGFSDTFASQKERWAVLQAKTLIEQHKESYQSLVKAMENRASIQECCQLAMNN